jgi:hypothetical protein
LYLKNAPFEISEVVAIAYVLFYIILEAERYYQVAR